MNIVNVKTKEQLKELFDASAMTWEGMTRDCFRVVLRNCSVNGEDGTGYLTTGKVMNSICHLTGNNAYNDDLNIFSVKDFVGLAVDKGARWMDDIILNNASREHYNPFEEEN